MRLFKSMAYGLLIGGLMACCTITIGTKRLVPKYKGVDPEVAPYVVQWLDMARDHGIKFDREVSIGFSDLNPSFLNLGPSIVGVCNYGLGFNEIDMDKFYWINSTSIGKMAVLYHELSHCYCNRAHDYVVGNEVKQYGDDEKSRKDPKKKDGFFDDNCPISLMYPMVTEKECFLAHYQEYMDEMFRECDPY
jgi:hypothetical protein